MTIRLSFSAFIQARLNDAVSLHKEYISLRSRLKEIEEEKKELRAQSLQIKQKRTVLQQELYEQQVRGRLLPFPPYYQILS